MSSRLGTKRRLYQEIALSRLRDREVDIDEMVDIYDEEMFWSDEELADVTREYKKTQLRRYARIPFYDENGDRVEQVNIKRDKAGPLERQQFFVFLDRTTREDLEWVIEDRVRKRQYFTDELKRFLDVYEQRFGRKARAVFQRRLRLDFGN